MYYASSCDRMLKLVPNAWKNSAQPASQTFALVTLRCVIELPNSLFTLETWVKPQDEDTKPS